MTSANSRQKILVTGAAGFVGSHLTRRLVKEGYDVNIIIRSSTDLQRIKDILPNLNCYTGDLSDFSGLSNIVKKIEPMGVFHLAASMMMSGVTAAPEEVIRSNFLGTVNLVNAVSEINYRFFINTGSSLEYGVKKSAVKESEPCEPLELYSITKLAGTFYCKTVAKAKNKPIITFRLFTPYGPFIRKGVLYIR